MGRGGKLREGSMEQQANRRKRSPGAFGGEWPVANGRTGAGEAPGGGPGEAVASWGERGWGVNEGNRLGCPHPDPFDPG
jgi:hypothetical protein